MHKDKLKRINDLSDKTINVLEENISSKISDISRSNIFAHVS